MQFTENVTLQPQLLGLMLRKDFWRKHKGIILASMFPAPLDRFYISVSAFHDKFEEDLDKVKLWEMLKMDNPTATDAQKADLYEICANITEVKEWSPEFAEKVLTKIWQQEVYRQIAEIGVQGIQGKLATLEPLAEIYNKHAERFIPKETFKECNLGVRELMESDSSTPTWKFALPVLQSKIGGMSGGQFLEYAARPDCYLPDTEVLTAQGWVSFKDYAGQPVAQITQARELEFVTPSRVISKHYAGNMVRFHDKIGRVDITVTPEHDMVIDKRKGLTKFKAGNPCALSYGKFHTAPVAHGFSGAFNSLSPMERLLIAFQADGSLPKDENNGNRSGTRTVRFSFIKVRKKLRLLEILKETGLEFYEDGGRNGKGKTGYTTYYVKWPVAERIQPLKVFDFNLRHVSPEWCAEFIEEMSHWDATRRSATRYVYTCTVKKNSETVQAIAAMAGLSTKYSVGIDTRSAKFTDTHVVSVRKYCAVATRQLRVDEVQYIGDVHCVTVPSGMLLVRSNGQTLVCGNCGKTALMTTFMCAPGGWAEQGALIDYYGNEEAIKRTRWRCISAYTGLTKDQLMKDPEAATAVWDKISQNVRTFEIPFGTPIEQIIARTKVRKPNIVIVDQLDKMSVQSLTAGGFQNEQDRTRLLRIKYRDMGKTTDSLVIGVGQASADAEGQRIVTYAMGENSKTGKGAECDVFLGIGMSPLKDNIMEVDYTRYITVSKNKLDMSWKGTFTCKLEPMISRYVD